MKNQESTPQAREANGLGSALDQSDMSDGIGFSQAAPPFQLLADGKQGPSMSKDGPARPAAPTYGDATDIVGNVSAGRNAGNDLNEESNRRIMERIAELEGGNAIQAGEEYVALEEAERAVALREAILRFQTSPAGQALIEQITQDNNLRRDGRNFYDRREEGALSPNSAPRARYHEGEVRNNDVTMQALVNAWPKNILGRMVNEEDAYDLIRNFVIHRDLPFDEASVNVVSVRGFQGGQMHDNHDGTAQGPFSRTNVYNDTTYILSKRGDVKHVTESRSTVDPGDAIDEAKRLRVFRMAADQQWDYDGNSRSRTNKFDRPSYGLADSTAVNRGRYWEQHPEVLAAALAAGHSGARVISDRAGRRFADVNAEGEENRFSAIHSGGNGAGTGDQVLGDSTGCSVVHGAWFPHFNESLRRASGSDGDIRFTYSLLDLRLFTPNELSTLVESL